MNDEADLDELMARWRQKRACGEEVSAAKLCVECPALIPELERRIQAMIAMEPTAETVAFEGGEESPPDGSATNPLPSALSATDRRGSSPPGVEVPGYEVLSVLGRGGMGVVYKARHQALNRLVALKMILSGGHTGPKLRKRFRGEAEVVARLKHPHIVEIHDIGEADGLPYFALEFLEGGTLRKKLAATPMPPTEAAALIETLARAVEHAHAHGVVHRDLKPSNVVLTATGQPKITDFGLAKQLDEEPGMAGAGPMTASGALVGTPSYMAPEQAAGKVKELGPACDIYALGAILYDCVAGRPPFRAASMIETLRQVTNAEPVSPRRLNAQVPRDLETICLKCLEKDPSKRYPSAAALADDLARFRAGKPVLARPIGALGRGLRWCRRNPGVAASLLLVGASLLAASVVSVWFGLNAEQARQAEMNRALSEAKAKEEAVEARNKAQLAQKDAEDASEIAKEQKKKAEDASAIAKEQEHIAVLEAQRSKEFSDLLLGVFESADPIGMQGYTFEAAQVGSPQMTAREILDRAVKKIRAQGRPELQATQLTSIGNVYRSLAMYKQAAELLEQAYALRQKDAATPPEEIADSLFYLGWLYHEQGQYPKAKTFYTEALERRRRLDAGSPKVTATLFNLAWLASYMGEVEQSETLFREVIARRLKQHGTNRHRDVAVAKTGLALVYLDNGEVKKALIPGMDAVATFRQLSPNDKLGDAMGLFLTSFAYEQASQYKLAATALEKALDLARGELTDNHPYVGLINYQLASVLESQRNYAEAEKRYRECLKLVRTTVGLGHPKTLLLATAMGRTLTRKGEKREAAEIFDEALKAHRERFGADHPLVADVLVAYASVPGMHSSGQRLKLLNEAVTIYEVGTKKYAMKVRSFKAALRDLSALCRQTGSRREGFEAALKRKQIFSDDPEELYDTACELAALAEMVDKADTADAQKLAEECTAAALETLAQAIGKGFADSRRLLIEPRFSSLDMHPGLEVLRRKLPAVDQFGLQIHRGRLTDQDPFDSKRRMSRCTTYNVHMEAGKTYQVDLRSADFDAFLRVVDEEGREKAFDDDSGGDLNSRIVFQPTASGDYGVIVTSFVANQTGAFVLAIQEKRKE